MPGQQSPRSGQLQLSLHQPDQPTHRSTALIPEDGMLAQVRLVLSGVADVLYSLQHPSMRMDDRLLLPMTQASTCPNSISAREPNLPRHFVFVSFPLSSTISTLSSPSSLFHRSPPYHHWRNTAAA